MFFWNILKFYEIDCRGISCMIYFISYKNYKSLPELKLMCCNPGFRIVASSFSDCLPPEWYRLFELAVLWVKTSTYFSHLLQLKYLAIYLSYQYLSMAMLLNGSEANHLLDCHFWWSYLAELSMMIFLLIFLLFTSAEWFFFDPWWHM